VLCSVAKPINAHNPKLCIFFTNFCSIFLYAQLFYSSVQRALLYTHHSCYESADRTMLWLWQRTEAMGGHRAFHHTAHLGNWSVFSQFVSQLLACVTFFHFVFFGHITATGYCLPITRVITQPLASTYPPITRVITQPLATTYPPLVFLHSHWLLLTHHSCSNTATGYYLPITRVTTQPLASTYPPLVF